VFASQVGLAGSVSTGDYVRLAGQVGIADHVHLGQGSTLGAKSGVHKDVPAGETWVGYPARPDHEELRVVMATMKLPEMRRTLRGLEDRVAELARQVEQLAATPRT
jgi:UDP-3-O-[3-hydroxymyristoyl] glucosamine N-acyltransferase